MIELCKMIAELEGTSSKNEKVAILKKWESDDLKTFLMYALDPYKRFYMRKIPRHKPAATSVADPLMEMAIVLTKLYKRVVTGHDAIDEVSRLLNSLDVADGDLFQRMLTKDLKCSTSIGTVNKAFPKLIPEFDVQLAAPWDGDKVTWPRLCEPKIDGMRCLAFVEGREADDVVFLSRSGKPIDTLGEIAEQIVKMFPVGTVLDGEAKQRGVAFEDSQSFVKRKTAKDDSDIVFTVFDCLSMAEFADQLCREPYTSRRLRFTSVLADAKVAHPHIEYLECRVADNIDEALEIYGDYRNQGHEGMILKDPNGTYDFKRNRTWMKMKPEETMDVEITGYEEGKKGKRIGKLGAFLFKYNGELCRAGGGFSDKQIAEFWENRDMMIGEFMEVSFMEKTAKGKTRHCNFVRMRTFKGEKC